MVSKNQINIAKHIIKQMVVDGKPREDCCFELALNGFKLTQIMAVYKRAELLIRQERWDVNKRKGGILGITGPRPIRDW